MPSLTKARIVVMATHGFEQSELEYPVTELKNRGVEVRIATPDGKAIRGWDGGDWGILVDADMRIDDVQTDDFDALVLPGGQINPDLLRAREDAVDVVRAFHKSGKPIAAICHAPWLLVEADVLRGREATSFGSIATDLKNAGAKWKNAEVVVDEAIITSRSPDDLAAFVGKIVEEVEEGPHQRDAA